MGSGLNTEVRHDGRVYHVQTENASRPGPAVETLIFEQGEILVRMTASYEELAARSNLTEMRQALELQHWDLVRKIHNGMLDEGQAASLSAAASRRADDEVRELLVELDGRLAEIFAEQQAGARPAQDDAGRRSELASGGVRRFPLSDWWHRHLKQVSVVVRW